jgi:hypothetical protein
LKNAEINRDRNLRLQYLAGMGVNSSQSALIYDDMVVYRKFPEDLFVASDEGQRSAAKSNYRHQVRVINPQRGGAASGCQRGRLRSGRTIQSRSPKTWAEFPSSAMDAKRSALCAIANDSKPRSSRALQRF